MDFMSSSTVNRTSAETVGDSTNVVSATCCPNRIQMMCPASREPLHCDVYWKETACGATSTPYAAPLLAALPEVPAAASFESFPCEEELAAAAAITVGSLASICLAALLTCAATISRSASTSSRGTDASIQDKTRLQSNAGSSPSFLVRVVNVTIFARSEAIAPTAELCRKRTQQLADETSESKKKT